LKKGSIKVYYEIIDSTNNVIQTIDATIMTAAVQTALNAVQPGQTVHIKRHPVFRHCKLSTNTLDTRGNYDFRTGADVQTRGGYKYFQPSGWKRYGLKVTDKYTHNGAPCNQWISMDGNPLEWAVGFHGTKDMAADPITTSGFIAGGGQAYMNSTCTVTNQTVGYGIYMSPHIETAESYCTEFTVGTDRYKLAFQCRLEPSAIRIPAKTGDHSASHPNDPDWDNDYWVVNDSSNIRPYGILLKKL